jgi:hypothetical protein
VKLIEHVKGSNIMNRTTLAVGVLLGLVLVFATANAKAETKNFKCSASGSFVDIPIDLDSDSCSTGANGVTVCTDFSAHSDYAGHCSPGGDYTGQNIVESVPVAGTGCNIFGNVVPGIASCTLANSSEQGCAFQVSAGSQVDRTQGGDLRFSTLSETFCYDLSSGPPFNFTGTYNSTVTGGTGKHADETGSFSGTFHGQSLTLDGAFHAFGWFEVNATGTITTP